MDLQTSAAKSIAYALIQFALDYLKKNYKIFNNGVVGWALSAIFVKMGEEILGMGITHLKLFQVRTENAKDAAVMNVIANEARAIAKKKDATQEEIDEVNRRLIEQAQKLGSFNHVT